MFKQVRSEVRSTGARARCMPDGTETRCRPLREFTPHQLPMLSSASDIVADRAAGAWIYRNAHSAMHTLQLKHPRGTNLTLHDGMTHRDPGLAQSVVVVGDSIVCKRFATRLSVLSGSCPSSARADIVVKILNKYYDSEVTLLTCTFQTLREQLLVSRLSHSVEGIVMVSEHGCPHAHAHLEELSRVEEGLDIRIMVVDRGPGIVENEQWQDKVQAACVEHCTEYCEVCTTDEQRDAELYEKTDPNGILRVLDAFGVHAWPDIRLAEPVAPKRGERKRQDGIALVDAARAELSDRVIREMQGAPPIMSASCSILLDIFVGGRAPILPAPPHVRRIRVQSCVHVTVGKATLSVSCD
jgi:hypothetical protein